MNPTLYYLLLGGFVGVALAVGSMHYLSTRVMALAGVTGDDSKAEAIRKVTEYVRGLDP